jgi:hypothetical protein
LFDSTVRDPRSSNDVDLLIVYDHNDAERAQSLREALLWSYPPQALDLVLLSSKEERDLEFIATESCVPVWTV